MKYGNLTHSFVIDFLVKPLFIGYGCSFLEFSNEKHEIVIAYFVLWEISIVSRQFDCEKYHWIINAYIRHKFNIKYQFKWHFKCWYARLVFSVRACEENIKPIIILFDETASEQSLHRMLNKSNCMMPLKCCRWINAVQWAYDFVILSQFCHVLRLISVVLNMHFEYPYFTFRIFTFHVPW